MKRLIAIFGIFFSITLAAEAQWANRVKEKTPEIGKYLSGFSATTGQFSSAPLASVSVTDFGADPSGATDSTTNISAAATAAASAGVALHIPSGTYLTSSQVFLPSNIRISCEKNAVFSPQKYFSVFATQNYNRDVLNDLTVTTPANQTDHDITIDGCTFDFRSVANVSGGSLSWDYSAGFSAYLARNIVFTNNTVIGGTLAKSVAGAIRFIGVDGGIAKNNTFTLVGVGVDVWKGSKNITITDNKISTFVNSSAWGNVYCIGVNGVGTSALDQETTKNFSISDNFCAINGTAAGIQFDALGPGSSTQNGSVTSNAVVATSGTGNQGIYARGDVENVTVSGNTFAGTDSKAIEITGYFTDGGPFTCSGCASTTSGSSSVVLAVASMDQSKVAVGNYIGFNSISTVGGLSLSGGYYPVTAVNPGVSVTINAGTNASSTVTGGGAISFGVSWKPPKNIVVSENKFDGASYVSSALVKLSGVGVQAFGNIAKGGAFGTFIQADSIDHNAAIAPYPNLFGNVSAVAGTWSTPANLPAGYTGDGIVAYSIYTPPATSVTGIKLSSVAASPIAPTIASGFGTSPTVVASNGTAAFQINVGAGGTASSGTITMPAAANGWACSAADVTTPSTNFTKQTASTITSVVITNYNASGSVAAWTASDKINMNCMAF